MGENLPEWIKTMQKLESEAVKEKGLKKLPPELEKELPEYIQLIRKFYFSLSEEDKNKLDSKNNEDLKMDKSDKSKLTKYCYECGKKINRSANFCEYCGAKQIY